jgi:hypothetical protein
MWERRRRMCFVSSEAQRAERTSEVFARYRDKFHGPVTVSVYGLDQKENVVEPVPRYF